MNRHLQYTREGGRAIFGNAAEERRGWGVGIHGPLLAACDTTDKLWYVGE